MTTTLTNSQRHKIECKKEGIAKGYARGCHNTGLDDIFLLPCEGLPQHVRFLQIPSQDFKVIIMTKESHAKA